MAAVAKLAVDWLRLDPDPETRHEIQNLLDNFDQKELEKRLRGRITFGTAGLRARMGAGFTFMNSLTVLQATQGLARYLLESVPDPQLRGIVIGCDARYNSEKFARIATECLLRFGFKVYRYDEVVHTPLVPFTVDTKSAAAGIMITASHNPKEDNGYKVYWGNGVQIIPPHDAGIATAIEEDLEGTSLDAGDRTGVLEVLGQPIRDAYSLRVQQMVPSSFIVPEFVYTAMHGVGYQALSGALQGFNFASSDDKTQAKSAAGFHVVPEQVDPDPEFPTVKFPNPEEKGALDIAKRIADENSVSLIIANDPDADRLAVAQKLSSSDQNGHDASSSEDRWHQFTGNELGVLLAAHVFEEVAAVEVKKKLAFLNTTVSTRMVRAMAESHGYFSAETLTGFKWLGNVAKQLEAKGYEVPFAFEEAIGYMFPAVVHDKDGVVAAVVFLYAVAKWQAAGLTPWQKLQSLYKEHGYFVEANTYLASPNTNLTNKIFNNIRSLGKPYPTTIGAFQIKRWRDLTVGYDSATKGNRPELPTDPQAQMITCELDQRIRFTVRSSGTESRIKIYVECQADTWDEADRLARSAQEAIIVEWFEPEKNGLELPS